MTPTLEQTSITDFVRSSGENILVNALAGTGKTTTLDMIQSASPIKPILCVAFNKRIADEMAKRFPSTTTVRTFNSLGHRIWAKTINVALDPKKTQLLLKDHLAGLKGDARREAGDLYWDVYNGVALAKSLGYVPEGQFPQAKRLITPERFHAALDERPSPLLCELIDAILFDSIQASYRGLVDYNDQVYMPALFGGTFPRFPFVMVDEFQDLNPVNHAMLDKLVKGRMAGVGDPWQSIYAFRGAVQGGIHILKTRFAMSEFPLSISFRCPQAIVEAARWRVPHFKWINPGGHVESLQSLLPSDIPEHSAIICRNNAPLFKLAFGLLAAKRSVSVAGSDIGPRIVRMLSKLGDTNISRLQLVAAIEQWREDKLETSQAPKTINDMAECMKVFASFGNTLGQAVAYAEHLFKQQGSLKLMTAHKSKGLEYDTVYHLDPWLMGDDEQELNLRYVAQTRTKQSYFEIDSQNIKLN